MAKIRGISSNGCKICKISLKEESAGGWKNVIDYLSKRDNLFVIAFCYTNMQINLELSPLKLKIESR